MRTVLVVDDSSIDQLMVGRLIEKASDYKVEFADDGESGLNLMDSISPDLVITDLMMPKMNGIELVQKAKVDHPKIPVILITAAGSETLAVEALKEGAASYVPKSALAEILMDTVEQILDMSEIAKSVDRIQNCITSSRIQFKLTNDPQLIQPLVKFINTLMIEHRFADDSLRRQARVALEEALINAIFHGNFEMTQLEAQTARREMHVGVTGKLVKERCRTKPFCQRSASVVVNIRHSKVQFIVRDKGHGFDTSKLPPIEDLDNISSPHVGRGLNLIGHLMDQIEFNEVGNIIRMELTDPNIHINGHAHSH